MTGNLISNFVGHKFVRIYLEKILPPVTLLQGPDSIGKRTLSHHLAAHHGALGVDLLVLDWLSTGSAREVVWSSHTAPHGRMKLVLMNLDGATDAAQNVLLKTLEGPPGNFKVIMRASEPVMPTITSRAHVFQMGLLSEIDLYQILVAKGMTSVSAQNCARAGCGQVQRAIASGVEDFRKVIVLNIVKAFAQGDRNLFNHSLDDATEDVLELLRTWAHEANTGRWRIFNPDSCFGIQARMLRRMMIELNKGIRPKILLKTMWDDLIPTSR